MSVCMKRTTSVLSLLCFPIHILQKGGRRFLMSPPPPHPPTPSLESRSCHLIPPQWGAADAEIKVPSGENTELTRSPFKAWSRSVYSHTCYVTARDFLLANFYPSGQFTCIFFQNLSRVFVFSPVLAVSNSDSCVGPRNEIGNPAWCRFRF